MTLPGGKRVFPSGRAPAGLAPRIAGTVIGSANAACPDKTAPRNLHAGAAHFEREPIRLGEGGDGTRRAPAAAPNNRPSPWVPAWRVGPQTFLNPGIGWLGGRTTGPLFEPLRSPTPPSPSYASPLLRID